MGTTYGMLGIGGWDKYKKDPLGRQVPSLKMELYHEYLKLGYSKSLAKRLAIQRIKKKNYYELEESKSNRDRDCPPK